MPRQQQARRSKRRPLRRPGDTRTGLNIVVLNTAHGGTDQGARGTEGITESDELLQFAAATKKALEAFR